MQEKYDLEADIRSSTKIVAKINASASYAQNLYAALCNMQWQRTELFPILADEYWTCSWRYAGGLVASIAGGDYMDYYCSGIGGFSDLSDETPEETARWIKQKGFVPEAVVTDEIREDLAELGWHPVPYDD